MASTQLPAANGDEQPLGAETEAKGEEAGAEEKVEAEEGAGAPGAADTTKADVKEGLVEDKPKWPGWPGYTVFRVIVPVLKVGGIIGRKGDLIKKLVEETRARVRVLDGPVTSLDRIVLIYGKEDPEAALPPAVDAAIRIFKRVNALPENDGDASSIATSGTAFCSIRFLVASTQAISLIGKQGSLIKSIQENTNASVRVLPNDELSAYATPDERIVELQGEGLKVIKALEAVLGHLRKFLVDQTVLPLFEKSYSNAPPTEERPADPWSDKTLMHAAPKSSLGTDYPVPVKRNPLFHDHEREIESHIPSSRLSLYAPDHGLGSRTSGIGRTGGPVVTQIAQTMQIPLAYAEDIIGVQGANIEYIRRTSGAILTVQESRGLPEEITVEIKGTSSQVQAAQQLIQEFTSGHREPPTDRYGKLDSSSRPSYSQLGMSSFPSSSFSGQPYGGYGSGYSSFRM
ncbi:RNA-binding KH domain-containing protein PEPPER [Andrographis paniculata]|uniref:RNA-binding KH domain-containing protein PEPPER n=1 Tax=Andrographis paniculata TaxID=175694 RepID=UPI0021E74E7E|nr:RNA-binding KH domain-containing protein PEPPER [Andrographis paniculata]